ncbi:hypothetical protein FA95DRAFT_1576813 [Auriscalpium vulgare]|uniref:Uncharacterized protein n=1 Tax=Auriscalpium vulgare TaxID=40419 RepID=A0ACB8RAP1_9AGAM|nr:hypothetical protein FA95DRAFT_1576813 [Auriscalpium vulgare]
MVGTTTDYLRHRDNRLRYQKTYNSVKRVGRRKVGKSEREREEDKRRAIISGLQRPYTNDIACKSAGVDSKRTPFMHAREHEVFEHWSLLRHSLMEQHPGDWASRYVFRVRAAINRILGTVDNVLATLESSPPANIASRIHRYRRLVAGLHQEVEFALQGKEVRDWALADHAHIFTGRR